MPFQNPLALLGLLSVIPLIIIYLIQPRPREVSFSSLLFLSEDEAERSAILNRLITDPLFWVQLLVLCSLSIAAAGPYITETGAAGSHLVVVLDASASMESDFPRALSMVDPHLERYERISIVLAGSAPAVVLQAGSSAEARDAMKNLAPRAVSADLSSAMNLAGGLLGPEGGDLLVVSDFISWRGDDPEATRKLLGASGLVSVVFADAKSGGENVAIVGGWSVESSGYINHTCLVHNFGRAREVPLTVNGPGGSSSRSVSMKEGEDYYFSFDAAPGVNSVSLEVKDAISSDNSAYIYVPMQSPKDVLYLGEDAPALAALQALPNCRVERSGEPASFDLIVVARNASLDGRLNRYIDGGGKVVYVAQSWNESPEYLPVRIKGKAEGPASLWVRSMGFAKDLHFEEIGIFSYPDASPRRHSSTMVEANGVPVLAYWRLGRGTVVYDGLEMDSDFYLRPEFPIFWYRMVNWLAGVPEFPESNRKTGEVIPLGERTSVSTPLGTVTTSNLLLDEVGAYSFQGRTVAANMYDTRESDLRGGASYPPGEFGIGEARETAVDKDLTSWLLALAAILVLLELAIIRWRREA
jgi:hypothetical protein